ncbi:MAG: hypothetical protein HUK03_10325 [Bacteroidaceae bacterium]|nr:hypothetical protein [Bacteroidaceae bacterium]
MRKMIWAALVVAMLTACHQSMDEHIKKETDDYTRRECPKPTDMYTTLDSVTYHYDDTTRIYSLYYTVKGMLDNDTIYALPGIEIHRKNVLQDIRTNLNYKKMREMDITFCYYYYSATRPGHEYMRIVYGPEDYQ